MHPARDKVRSIAPARLLLTGALAVALGACGGPAATTAQTTALATPSQTAAASASPTLEVTLAPVATPTAAAAPTPAPTAAPVTAPPVTPVPLPSVAALFGTPLIVGEQQAMSVLRFEQWTDPGDKPASGYVFVTVSIRIDAIKLTQFASADFKLRNEAGKLFKWQTGRSPHLYDLANLEPGHNYVGWITYEVPKTSVAKLVLVYAPSFLVGSKFEVPLY